MPRIQEYNSQVQASGTVGGRSASAADFGPSGLENVAAAMGNVGDMLQRREEESEVSDIRARMAQANADWTETYIERQQQAAPGDMSFAQTLKKDMGSYFDEMRGTIRTRRGQELFGQLSTSMAGQFTERAMVHQATLAGQKAKLDFTNAIESHQRVLAQDPSQYEALVQVTLDALDDQEGPYARLPAIAREELRANTRAALASAAVDGFIEGGGARDFLDAVRPQANAVRANGVPIGGVATETSPAPSAGGPNSRGIRNNNPGNIVKSKTGWAGKVEGSDERFETFSTPEAGIAALTKNLITYDKKHGLNTVAGIINRWAPPNENNTAVYIAAVAKAMGVKPDETLDMRNPGVLTQLTAAIIQHENGAQPYTPEQMSTGIQGALGNAFIPPQAPVAADLPEATPDSKSITIGDAAFDALPYAQQLQKIRLAETRVNQEMAVLQARVKTTLRDHEAEAMTTGVVRQQLTQRDFHQAFGEAEGAEMWGGYKKNVIELGADVQRVRGMSVGERQDLLARYAGQIQGEGAAQAASRYESITRAVKVMDEALKKDPAAYAINLSPAIMSAFQRVSEALVDQNMPAEQKAAVTLDYATKAIAEQKRLGVDKPVLLPDAHADKIVSQFYEQQQGGQNAAVLMQALTDQWGQYWPQVYGQMASKLPSAAVVIGAGMKPGPASLLAEASTLGRDEMRKTLDPSAARDIDDQLRREMAPFLSTMTAQNGGDLTANRVFEGTELLALRYMRAGMSAGDAAKQAFNDTVGEKYTFHGTFRVPVEHNADAVIRGAQTVLNNLDSFGLAVPESAVKLDEADARATYINSLKAYSKWVTATDETGLVLYNAFGGAVMGADGQPLKLTWADLAARGAPARSGRIGNPMQKLLREQKAREGQ